MNGYCFKCKTKREIENPETYVAHNGRPMTRGRCPVCRTRIQAFGAPKEGTTMVQAKDSDV